MSYFEDNQLIDSYQPNYSHQNIADGAFEFGNYLLSPENPAPGLTQSQTPDQQAPGKIATTSMCPPSKPRKPKAPTLRTHDWEPYKARILELHIDQKLPLRQVKQTIEREFEFTAELRQYRTRISQWGKDKNIKPQEMKAIVRKQQKRNLVEIDKQGLQFSVRGNMVDPSKVNRWMKRNQIPASSLYAPSPAESTPSAVGCWTGSEEGSLTPNAINTTKNPSFSVINPESVTHSPDHPSPASSISGIIRSGESEFVGQSPTPTYQVHPNLHRMVISTLDSAIYTTQTHTEQTSTDLVQYRYKQMKEERLRQELSKLEMQPGTDSHPETLRILLALGDVLIDQGRYKSAEEVIRRLVKTCQVTYGGSSSNTLEAFNTLGRVLHSQGFYPKAEKIHKRTLESRRAILGHQHPDTLASIGNLASAYRDQGRWKEAEELDIQVVEAQKRVLGPEHPDTLISISCLASTYWCQGRWKEAEELDIQVVEAQKRVLGPEDPDTLISISCLASTYWYQGRWKEAEELEIQVIEAQKRVLGPEHPDILLTTSNLASTYRDQGRWKEAEELEVETIEAQKRVLGPEHPDTLLTISGLASTYWSQGRWKEADELEVQAMEARTRVLGPEHPDTLTGITNLAFTSEYVGLSEGAIRSMEKGFQVRNLNLGSDNPSSVFPLDTLNDGEWL